MCAFYCRLQSLWNLLAIRQQCTDCLKAEKVMLESIKHSPPGVNNFMSFTPVNKVDVSISHHWKANKLCRETFKAFLFSFSDSFLVLIDGSLTGNERIIWLQLNSLLNGFHAFLRHLHHFESISETLESSRMNCRTASCRWYNHDYCCHDKIVECWSASAAHKSSTQLSLFLAFF